MADSDNSDDDDAPTLVALNPDEPQVQDGSAAPCPVTILSGFLGAGKTTLIQYILQSPDHGKRIAIIENEFGGGDGMAVESLIARDGSANETLIDLMELPNGCICCTVKDSLVTTLEVLLQRRQNLDYILIECSGMANPGPIASLFWLDDALESRLRLDGIVTLCDAKHILQQLQTTEEAAQQVAYADRIMLNKIDLVDEGTVRNVVRAIRAFHPTAPIRQTRYSQIDDLNWIMDAKCFDVDRVREVEKALATVEDLPSDDDHHHSHEHDHDCKVCQEQPNHRHTANVSTLSLSEPGSVTVSAINQWLATILWPQQDEQESVVRAKLQHGMDAAPDDNNDDDTKPAARHGQTIFRIKGIISVEHESASSEYYDAVHVNDALVDRRRYIVQAVHDLWEVYPASTPLAWTRHDRRTCQLVVIGKFLDEPALRQGLQGCLRS